MSDFFYPLPILKLKRLFDRSQWWDPDRQLEYQESRLRVIVDEAYRHVPYYTALFDRLGLKPSDIRTVRDLAKLPVMNKQTLRENFDGFKSRNAARHRPILVHTSGTSGKQLHFLVDKHANVLEFVNYWRYWGWGGYRLGDRFAEFSGDHFMAEEDAHRPRARFQAYAGRLIFNSIALSEESAPFYAGQVRKHRPKFIKGRPSVLYYFALFLKRKGITDVAFKSAFCCGEVLMPHQRKFIEETLHTRVFDAYGVMERVATVSECERGGLHENSEYGVIERLDAAPCAENGAVLAAKIVGTSLYNRSMPLLRYDTGDGLQYRASPRDCPCGRRLPLVEAIDGRREDVIVTPDGRVFAALYLVWSEVEGVLQGQIVQEEPAELRVRVVRDERYTPESESKLRANLERCLGKGMKVFIEPAREQDLIRPADGKFKAVVSRLAPKAERAHGA